jgi:hypothetical protein
VIQLSVSLAVFVSMWLLHVVWFRASLPSHRVQALLALFASGLVFLATLLMWSPACGDSTPLPATALALYIVCSFAYIIVYTAVEVDSPSALIILIAAGRAEEGITHAQLHDELTDDMLVLARLRDLISAGSVSFDGTRYRLEPRGLLIARTFEAYRALLRRGLGG